MVDGSLIFEKCTAGSCNVMIDFTEIKSLLVIGTTLVFMFIEVNSVVCNLESPRLYLEIKNRLRSGTSVKQMIYRRSIS